MPRAAKPRARLGAHPKPFRLSREDRDKLLVTLKTGSESTAASQLVAAVEREINTYRERKRNARVTPQSLKVELGALYRFASKRIKSAARRRSKLFRSKVSQLSDESRGLLLTTSRRDITNFDPKSLALEIEKALEELTKNMSDGRYPDWPRSLLVNELFFDFWHLRRLSDPNAAPTKPEIRGFVSTVLRAANIRHPDPKSNSTRFDRMSGSFVGDKTRSLFDKI